MQNNVQEKTLLTVLTETAGKTLNFCHHLEIRGICFNGLGFDSIPESLRLVLAAA